MKYTIEESRLREIVKESLSIAQVLRVIGLVAVGGNYKTIKAKVKKWNIDTSHFTGAGWNTGDRFKAPKPAKAIEEYLIKDSLYTSSYNLKGRLFKEGFKEKRCEECNNYTWMGNPIALELHHINGINTDNRIENLQILCPNCHANTDNYRGKNQERKITKVEKIKLVKENPVNLCSCGNSITNKAKECPACRGLRHRKVERPSKDLLLEQLKGNSYEALGRKYKDQEIQ